MSTNCTGQSIERFYSVVELVAERKVEIQLVLKKQGDCK